MIFLHTGLPGAGKTLFTLAHLKPLAEAGNRQVYYYNIQDLMIPGWIELTEEQALNWFDLPAGSIIVLDEAQRIFRMRVASSRVPPHVERLETHRHQGIDLYLITQHPGLIDTNVRRLVGTHRHVKRVMGAKYAAIHTWTQCKDDCHKTVSDADKTQFIYPPEVFQWYKSAELHTHKVAIPRKVYYLFALVAFIATAAFFAYRGLTKVPAIADRPEAPSPAIYAGNAPPSRAADGPLSAEDYIATYAPRIPDLPHTAPRYDQVTEPTRAPYPAGCVDMRGVCKCFTDQATPIKVTESTCQNIVKNGFYKDWGEAAQPQVHPAEQPYQPDYGHTAKTYDSGRLFDRPV